MKTAIAIAAHPDDIELMMAGTLLLLKDQGYEIHYFNLSTGSVGTTEYDVETIKNIRLREAQEAAAILGAHFHSPVCDDLEIFYDEKNASPGSRSHPGSKAGHCADAFNGRLYGRPY